MNVIPMVAATPHWRRHYHVCYLLDIKLVGGNIAAKCAIEIGMIGPGPDILSSRVQLYDVGDRGIATEKYAHWERQNRQHMRDISPIHSLLANAKGGNLP